MIVLVYIVGVLIGLGLSLAYSAEEQRIEGEPIYWDADCR